MENKELIENIEETVQDSPEITPENSTTDITESDNELAFDADVMSVTETDEESVESESDEESVESESDEDTLDVSEVTDESETLVEPEPIWKDFVVEEQQNKVDPTIHVLNQLERDFLAKENLKAKMGPPPMPYIPKPVDPYTKYFAKVGDAQLLDEIKETLKNNTYNVIYLFDENSKLYTETKNAQKDYLGSKLVRA